MIPCLPRIRITYILIPFPIMLVFGGNIIRRMLNSNDVDFAARDVDEVLIWKITGNCEPFTRLQYNGEDFHFSSEGTYLIVAKTSHMQFITYYWLGKNTSLRDKQMAAMYAVELNKTKSSSFYIARETESMESDSFQFAMAGNSRSNDFITDFINLHLPSPRPNLYVILGEGHSKIKKIPLSLGLNWLKRKDTCLVLEVEYEVMGTVPVHYFCASGANEKQVERTKNFANKFLGDIFNDWQRESHLIEKLTMDFKQFIELLENEKFYNPNDVDDSGDHLKKAADFVTDRNVEVALYDITSNGLKLNLGMPNRSSKFFRLHAMGHILDSKSVAGVFVILAGSNECRVEAIQQAEKYMDDTYPLSSGHTVRMRIIQKYEHPYILDHRINFSDFPFLDWNVPEDELW